MQSSRGHCYSSWEKRSKESSLLPLSQLMENEANLFSWRAEMQVVWGRWMAMVKCSKKMESSSLGSSIQSTGHLSLNMKEQHSSLWGLAFRSCDTGRCGGSTELPGTKPEVWKCISLHMQLPFLLISGKKKPSHSGHFEQIFDISQWGKKKPPTKHVSSQLHSFTAGFQAKLKRAMRTWELSFFLPLSKSHSTAKLAIK